MLATGGLLAEDVRTVVADLRGQSTSLRIGGAHHTSEQWSAGLLPGVAHERRCAHVIELNPGGAGDVPAAPATHGDVQTRVRLDRAARLGVEVETATGGRLVPFAYQVYRACGERGDRRTGAAPGPARRVEPYAAFTTVAATTGESCWVSVAWYRGRPIATLILLVHGLHAVVWRSHRLGEVAAPVSAGVLLQVAAAQAAVRAGCRFLDLGPSGDVNLGADQDSLGASPRSVVDLRIEPAGLARLRAARGRAEGVLARALTRSPAGPVPGRPTP